jgi:iron(III) transport system ATP-binding protein
VKLLEWLSGEEAQAQLAGLNVEDAEVQARVLRKSFRGPNIIYQLELPSGEQCQALVSSHHNHSIGELIGIVPEVDNLVVFPKRVKHDELAKTL